MSEVNYYNGARSDDDGYQLLAIAVIKQACVDYGNPDRSMRGSCQKFFLSDYFQVLCNGKIDGKKCMEAIDKNVRETGSALNVIWTQEEYKTSGKARLRKRNERLKKSK